MGESVINAFHIFSHLQEKRQGGVSVRDVGLSGGTCRDDVSQGAKTSVDVLRFAQRLSRCSGLLVELECDKQALSKHSSVYAGGGGGGGRGERGTLDGRWFRNVNFSAIFSSGGGCIFLFEKKQTFPWVSMFVK